MPTFSDIILAHLKRYPRMKVQDLYKLAYQAALGAEHAAANLEEIHSRLEAELAGLTNGPVEPLVDPISPDGRILRLHLRPFKVGGGDVLQLCRAFLQSAAEYHGTINLLEQYYLVAVDLSQEGELAFKSDKLLNYLAKMKRETFLPVHHSITYCESYLPAYRVILRELLPIK